MQHSPGLNYPTYEDLVAKIDIEGFDYFFRYYAQPQHFTDPILRKYAEAYVTAAWELQNYVNTRLAWEELDAEVTASDPSNDPQL